MPARMTAFGYARAGMTRVANVAGTLITRSWASPAENAPELSDCTSWTVTSATTVTAEHPDVDTQSWMRSPRATLGAFCALTGTVIVVPAVTAANAARGT